MRDRFAAPKVFYPRRLGRGDPGAAASSFPRLLRPHMESDYQLLFSSCSRLPDCLLWDLCDPGRTFRRN
jgi:hypothetical protein